MVNAGKMMWKLTVNANWIRARNTASSSFIGTSWRAPRARAARRPIFARSATRVHGPAPGCPTGAGVYGSVRNAEATVERGEHPGRADQQEAKVLEKGRPRALDRVADELADPAEHEHDGHRRAARACPAARADRPAPPRRRACRPRSRATATGNSASAAPISDIRRCRRERPEQREHAPRDERHAHPVDRLVGGMAVRFAVALEQARRAAAPAHPVARRARFGGGRATATPSTREHDQRPTAPVDDQRRVDEQQPADDQQPALHVRAGAQHPLLHAGGQRGDADAARSTRSTRRARHDAVGRHLEQQADARRVEHEHERHDERRQRVLPRLQRRPVRDRRR